MLQIFLMCKFHIFPPQHLSSKPSSDNRSEVLTHMKKNLQLLILIRSNKMVFCGRDPKWILDLSVLSQKATISLHQDRFSSCLSSSVSMSKSFCTNWRRRHGKANGGGRCPALLGDLSTKLWCPLSQGHLAAPSISPFPSPPSPSCTWNTRLVF